MPEMIVGDREIGTYLQRETARILNAGPSRSLNAKPQTQPDGYNLSSIEGMLAAEEEKARREFIARQTAKVQLERAGFADAGPSAEEIVRLKK